MSIFYNVSMGFFIVFSGAVHAAVISCGKYDGFPGENATLTVSGNISVGNETPNGTVIYTAAYTASKSSGIKCVSTSSAVWGAIYVPYISDYSSFPYPEVPGMIIRNSKVYQTNVPGIGVTVANLPGRGTLGTSSAIINGRTMTFRVALVKTGPITTGIVDGSSFPTVKTTFYPPDSTEHSFRGFPIVTNTLNFNGKINLVASTCTLENDNIIVPLGDYEIKEFTGVGYTTEWKNAAIRLKGCSAFNPGYYSAGNTSINITGSGKLPSGSQDVKNKVSIVIKPTTLAIDHRKGIVSLTSSKDSAKGIGIQLGMGTDIVKPLILSSETDVALPDSSSNILVIPVKARYIQTAMKVTPGTANGAVTFIINYY